MNRSASSEAFALQIHFHGDLPIFVRANRGRPNVVRQLREKTSVKDAIEACGVPHPEIDLILVNQIPVEFSYPLEMAATIEVYPVPAPPELFPESRLQRREQTRFVADGHLGKLARDLRLLGIDVAYEKKATDAQLVALAAHEQRALLTRDRRLLMYAAIENGFYPRSQNAEEQTSEVIRRFNLAAMIYPFTRCLHCGANLQAVPKSTILHQLEPLTKIYYEDFSRCTNCGRIYWAGSHLSKLEGRIQRITAALSP